MFEIFVVQVVGRRKACWVEKERKKEKGRKSLKELAHR